jgi:hypothetical protein
MASTNADSEWVAVQAELRTAQQNSRKNSSVFIRRQENIEWIQKLSLIDLAYNNVEMQIDIVTTKSGERIVIQYPGKESIQGTRKWKNPWDFRPKILKEDAVDLTFQQIWDPLFDELNLLRGEKKMQIGQALATLFYRMAYMVDYRKEPVGSHKGTAIRVTNVVSERKLPSDIRAGSFWTYQPPPKSLDFISANLPDWKGMSFEAFLHYNSLLAWNEDCKMAAKIEDWDPTDHRGRINTLLTHVRVVGFVLGKVRPSELLGGFASMRGMSPASTKEIRKICSDMIV